MHNTKDTATTPQALNLCRSQRAGLRLAWCRRQKTSLNELVCLFLFICPRLSPSVSPPYEKSEREFGNELILRIQLEHLFCMMVQTQGAFAPLDFIYSAYTV